MWPMRRALSLLIALPLLVTGQPAPASATPGARAVVETRVIGHSVQGRPILAYRTGEPGKPVVLVMATMHGDERSPRRLLKGLLNGAPVTGVDLWLVPTYNPDGAAHHSRRNAHGVDLNRNFPYRWKHLTGSVNSGPRPASEPETRAMMAFLGDIAPHRIVSFHQPLHGVDRDTKLPGFSRKLARALHLPLKTFACGGACHGTMTMWFNHGFDGAAVTAELGAHPSRRDLGVRIQRRLLRVLGGAR